MLLYLGNGQQNSWKLLLCLLVLRVYLFAFYFLSMFKYGWISHFWFLFWFGLQSRWHSMGWRWVYSCSKDHFLLLTLWWSYAIFPHGLHVIWLENIVLPITSTSLSLFIFHNCCLSQVHVRILGIELFLLHNIILVMVVIAFVKLSSQSVVNTLIDNGMHGIFKYPHIIKQFEFSPLLIVVRIGNFYGSTHPPKCTHIVVVSLIFLCTVIWD